MPLPMRLTGNEGPEKSDLFETTFAPLPESTKEAVERLNSVLKKFEGANSYHNFHRMSGRDMKQFVKKKGDSENADGDGAKRLKREEEEDENEEENEVEEEEEEEDGEESDDEKQDGNSVSIATPRHFRKTSPSDKIYRAFLNWEPKPRDIVGKTRSIIFWCEAIETFFSEEEGEEMVRVRFRGQSFLLHQIRLMMGTAILATRGVLPSEVIDKALLAPIFIPFPMAPAEGLILLTAGFGRNSNRESIAVSAEALGVLDTDTVLLSQDAWQTSKDFLRHKIYNRIEKDWIHDDGVLMTSWLNYNSEKYRVPRALAQSWKESLLDTMKAKEEEDIVKDGREASRINFEVAKFEKLLEKVEKEAQAEKSSQVVEKNVETKKEHSTKKHKKLVITAFPHRKFLRNTVSSAVVVHFRALPGNMVYEALRAVATKVAMRQLPHDLQVQEVVQLLSEKGLEHWARNEDKHPLIE